MFLLCSLKYCSWLGPLLMPTPLHFSLSTFVPHGSVHQFSFFHKHLKHKFLQEYFGVQYCMKSAKAAIVVKV